MIKFSPISRILNTLNPQNILKSSSNPGRLFFFCFGLAVVVFNGCSGKNIHSRVGENVDVLVRQWTIQSRESIQAGDRGSDLSNAVLFDSTLIFGSRGRGLVSFYPQIMAERWNLPIKGGVASPILLDKNILYFGGGDGVLYSVKADNGAVLWTSDIKNPYVSKPSFAGGRLFVTTTDNIVYALDAVTGKSLWHYKRRSPSLTSVTLASSPLMDGKDVLVGLSDGFLVCLSVDDGQLKWEKKLHFGTRFTDVDATPVLENGIIYVSSYDGSLYALKRQNGDILWKADMGGTKSIVIEGDRIYFPSSDGEVLALQKSTGKTIWKFELDRGTPTELIVTEQYLMFGSSFQYLYVIDKKNGRPVYRYNVGWDSGFYGSPVFDPANRLLYILSQAGNLYSFLLRSPRQLHWLGHSDGYVF